MKLTSIMFCNYVYIRNLFDEKEIGTVGFRKFQSLAVVCFLFFPLQS